MGALDFLGDVGKAITPWLPVAGTLASLYTGNRSSKEKQKAANQVSDLYSKIRAEPIALNSNMLQNPAVQNAMALDRQAIDSTMRANGTWGGSRQANDVSYNNYSRHYLPLMQLDLNSQIANGQQSLQAQIARAGGMSQGIMGAGGASAGNWDNIGTNLANLGSLYYNNAQNAPQNALVLSALRKLYGLEEEPKKSPAKQLFDINSSSYTPPPV